MSRLMVSGRIIATARSIPLSSLPEQIVDVHKRSKQILPSASRHLTAQGFSSSLSLFNGASVSCGIAVSQQVRFSHVDVTNVPDFSGYRTKSTKNPHAVAADTEVQRKVFTYTLAFAGTVLAATTAKYAVKTMIQTLGPSAKTLAMASIEVDLSRIAIGSTFVVKWRNKPLFVRYRTEEDIARERAVPLSELRHPQTDEERVQDPKWLVCLGICTHLGCVPIANAGEYAGGYYCPCHGSHYDGSGRIRKGPAPLNLEVPEYQFLDENTLKVG